MADLAEPEMGLSPNPLPFEKVNILGWDMAYTDTQPSERRSGRPVALFLHGNPTSSYLWRNVIPHVSPLMRCVAPDLIGMGNSSKLPNSQYRFTDHYTFLASFIETVLPESPVLIVAHDWGSALGLHWAREQAERPGTDTPPRVLGLVLMEFLRPFADWDDFTQLQTGQKMFQAYRTPVLGRKLIIEENAFVEKSLASGVLRGLTEAEHDHYRRPFLHPGDRFPTYAWPNQIPINHEPKDVYEIATKFQKWMFETEVPKLIFWATPGFFVTQEKARWYGEHLKNVEIVHVGKGSHWLSEDHPRKIGIGIHEWVRDTGLTRTS